MDNYIGHFDILQQNQREIWDVKRSKEGGRKKNNDEGKDKQVLCTWYSELGWSSPQDGSSHKA